MDFQTLARRDLQALCKRNKIPANMTNLAMAEALKSLELVEGIDDVMQSSQSGTAHPSTESFEMADVTSQTRSTRRLNIPKPAPESVNPTTRTRRTTRKTQAKDVDAIETPAPMSQTSRKNVQTVSACLNMDSQLMECADMDTDTKDSLLTPAPVRATTTRRRRVEVSAAKSVHNTRRSGRLALKTSVEKTSNDVSGFSDKTEVIPLGEEESEVVSDQNDAAVVEEIKMGSYAEEEAKVDKEKCDYEEEMPLNVSNEVQQDNGSQDVCISEIEIAAEKSIEELKPEGSSEVEEMSLNVSNEVQQNNGSQDVCISEIEIATEKSIEELKPEGSSEVEEMPLNVSNKVQQDNGSQDVCISEIEIAVEKSIGEHKPEESSEVEQDFVDNVLESRDNIVADGNTGFNDEIKEELDDSMIMDGSFRDVTDSNVAFVQTSNENEASIVEESLQLEEIEKATAADPVQSDEPFADLSKQLPESDIHGFENVPTEMEILHLEESEKSAEPVPSSEDSASVTKMDVASESIATEAELVVTSDDTVKMAEKNVDGYHAMSMRQLKKMIKEMDINKKPSKSENAADKATARTALQVISENQMVVDEPQE